MQKYTICEHLLRIVLATTLGFVTVHVTDDWDMHRLAFMVFFAVIIEMWIAFLRRCLKQ